MWKHSRGEPDGSRPGGVALECEALLTGRYAEYLRARARWVPPWAWVNALAHSTEAELAAAARDDADALVAANPTTREWRGAFAFLAADVLEHLRSAGVTLAELQRSTLIPLELELMRGPGRGALRPRQLAGIVMAAVRGHPSRPR